MELEFQNYPKFTPEMKKTHKILIPNMAPVQFRILAAVMRQAGYTCELLENCGSQVSELGLKYVHNDTCYPALLVIGQFLDALGSGKYDLDNTALIITQTGGGCRASNYIHLLRKALVKAGYGQVPVVSLNFSGLEKDSGFPMTLPLMRKLLACIYYGDLLVALKAQTEPYETPKGDAAALQEKWLDTICGWVMEDKGWSGREIKAAMPKIAAEFAAIPVHRVPKVKVGVVGEIYVKYSPLGNNDLEKFLASQDCEVNLPGLMGFVQYCAYNRRDDRAGAGRVREHRLRPAIRLPAQPHLRQGDDQQDPGAVPPGQHHPHRLRSQRHPGESGEPHQADAGGGPGAAGGEDCRPECPGDSGARRDPTERGGASDSLRINKAITGSAGAADPRGSAALLFSGRAPSICALRPAARSGKTGRDDTRILVTII